MLIEIRSILESYDLGEIVGVSRLGGTGAPKFHVDLETYRFVLRQRQKEFANVDFIRFDHSMLLRLHKSRLPVPCPQYTKNGLTWVDHDGDIYELLSWVDGEPFNPEIPGAICNLGTFMACFHEASSNEIPPGKEGVKREDHPDLLMPYVNIFEGLCRTESERSEINKIREQVLILKSNLEDRLYGRLPKSVIHGDVHPGNIMFKGAEVSAVYDFDYMSTQARVRDICDCLAFFASTREGEFDVNDIYSLTQAFRFDDHKCQMFLNSYQKVMPIEPIELDAMPEILRALWLNMKLRGSRKVADDQKLAFVMKDFWSMLGWVNNESPQVVRRWL